MYKRVTYLVLIVLPFVIASDAICAEFMRGADISIQTRQDADGVVYRENGVAKDAVAILKNHDLNWIRIRLFHTPSGSPYGVCQNLNYVTALAARVKAQGFKFLLDFHYSDTWADPGNQDIPAAWAGYTHSELVTAVHDYTRDVIVHLRTNGVMPEMVQIGNEVIGGMLWPDGQLYGGAASWSNFVDLINAGIAGVDDGRGSEPMPKIMIHIDRGGDWGNTEWFFDNLLARGVQFDVIGQSFYPQWHGTLDDLANCLNNMAANYPQDIVVAEAGDYYTGSGKTPESQKAYLEGVIERLQALPGGKGIGVFYWEPTWVYNESTVARRALFEPIGGSNKNVNMLMAMEAFDNNDDVTPPAAPTGLSATGGDSTVSLNWNDNSEEDLNGYNVYRSLTSGSGYVKLNGSLVSSSNYTDNNVDGYVTYYYVVTAVDTSTNESDNSSEASATPTDTMPPAAPTGLTAIAGDSTISLNWNDNSEGDLDGYNVYRSTTSGSGYVQLNGSLLSSSDYIDNSVVNGTTYYYVVTAVDTSSNESGYLGEASATPNESTIYNFAGITAADTNYNAFACDVDVFPFAGDSGNRSSMVEATNSQYTYISTDDATEWTTVDPLLNDEIFLWVEMKVNELPANIAQIDLTFDGCTGSSITAIHKIFVLTAGADWTLDSSWTQVGSDQSILPGSYVRMTRYITSDISNYIDANGKIVWAVYETRSSETIHINYLEMAVLVSAGTTSPAAPTSLSATAGNETVSLDWNDNGEADLEGYNIYRSTTSGSGYNKLNSSLLISSYYDDNDVANITTYYYVVTAVDTNSNESAYSGEISATPRIYGDFITNGIVEMNDLDYFCQLWLVDDCNLTLGVDLDDDCMINFYEFSVLAENWLKGNYPRIYGDFIINGIVEMNDLDYFCQLWLVEDCNATAGVDLNDDCMINFYEFSAFADNWLK